MSLRDKLDIKVFRERTKQFLIGLFVIFFFVGIYYMAQGGFNAVVGLMTLLLSLIGLVMTLVYE